jgi:D-aspartate ligase
MFNGYFDHRSECLFGATGRKIRQWPPHRGSTSLGICLKNDMVETQTKQLMQAVAYRGPLDVGYRFDSRDGQYKLLDVNPRMGATFRLFVAMNGLDVARALYLDLTGQAIPPAEVHDGRKWIVESNDLAASWTYFRERQLDLGEYLVSLRGVEEGVWLDSGDLAPLATLPYLWFRKHFRPTEIASLLDHRDQRADALHLEKKLREDRG